MKIPSVTSTGIWIGGVWTYELWREEWIAAWAAVGKQMAVEGMIIYHDDALRLIAVWASSFPLRARDP